jgi:hypothetical protein
MTIAQTKPPHPRRLEGRAPVGSTQSYHFATTKKTGADPSAGDEKEASARRVKREQSVTKLVRNTR